MVQVIVKAALKAPEDIVSGLRYGDGYVPGNSDSPSFHDSGEEGEMNGAFGNVIIILVSVAVKPRPLGLKDTAAS